MYSPYSDGSGFDALMDGLVDPPEHHLDPDFFPDVPLFGSPIVAADRAAAARGPRGDVAPGSDGVGSQSRGSLPHSSASGAGADAENVSSARVGPGAA